MLFNSYVFLLVFLPLTLAGWWLLPGRQARLLFLTVASYVFYGWWDYRFVPLMILSTSADFMAGAAIARSPDRRHRTVWLVLLLVFNLGILAVFKYFDFFAGSLNGMGRALGFAVDLPLMHLVLPVGISFFGAAFSEPKLIKMAYAFEQATKARRTPKFLPTPDFGRG